MLEIEKTYLLSIPPGWLIVGTVDRIENGIAYLRHSVYIETVSTDAYAICRAQTAKKMVDAVQKHYSIPGLRVRLDCITHAAECFHDTTPLYRSEQAEAIKKS